MPTSAESRPAFEFFEGFAVSSVLASLEMAGILSALEDGGIAGDSVRRHPPEEAALLESSLRYLTQRGLLEERDGTFVLSELGLEVCRDKGYLVWLVGGYGEPLRRLDAFLAGGKRYGVDYVRDGRWVANGAAMLGRGDVVPHAMRLLERARFDSVLDIGCGNARFLLAVCEKFGARGVGLDLSPEACSEAMKAVSEAGLTGRVQIACGDAAALDAIPSLGETELVVTFFLLHEILAGGRDRLVAYLSELSSRLPAKAKLLIAEVEPPSAGTRERFTPEFTYVHALMRQRLFSAEQWQDALREGGFVVREVERNHMPGGILLLCENAA
jgi:SAM-dependent methyltransferase